MITKSLMLALVIGIFGACTMNTKPDKAQKNTSKTSQMLEPISSLNIDSMPIESDNHMHKQLAHTRKLIKYINTIESWNKTKRIENSDAYKEKTVSYFYKDDSISKIKIETYEVEQQSLIEYYAINNKLIFVYENIVSYNRPIYWDSTEMIKNNDTMVFDIAMSMVYENLSFFENQQLIHQTSNKNGPNLHTKAHILNEQKRLLKAFESLKQQKSVN